MRYDNDTCCFRCGRPGDLCYHYSNKQINQCRYRNVIIESTITAFIFHDAGLKSLIEDVAQRGFVNKNEYQKWLGKKCRILGWNGTNALAVFEELVRRRSGK